ncbi:uncharacterized protein CTRU02_206125 [Colletotrichum truncatum]|uniref:Uncharacterized protein n=1 Tax=Colletotrichum truncatum TaxID=5467 RepID=A0ACC3Z622_COLTU|nr:uncharacterized protein CTRU02_10460 [Colletotrichum truncatum]KAF6787197.1 hypothetical protein CTRU02_10460 [Colletotrichum truncatum]
MAPAVPVSDALAGLIPRSASSDSSPTKTLPLALRDIFIRQTVVTVTATPNTDESASDNNLSGGAIAGIVIGSIAGFLLLLWIIKSCGMWSKPDDWAEKDAYRGRSPASRHHRRHHGHGHYHHETSRSRRPSYEINEVRYAQPVTYEKRRASASPRAPAPVYHTSRSRSRY